MHDFVRVGDIFIDPIGMELPNNYYTGHTGIISSIIFEDNDCKIECIEAVGIGRKVEKRAYTPERFYNSYMYRLSNWTNSKVYKSLYFAEQQVGKPYLFKTGTPNTNIDSKNWYCSELVCASIKYGFDIDLSLYTEKKWIEPVSLAKDSNMKMVASSSVDDETTYLVKDKYHVLYCNGDLIREDHCYDEEGNICRMCHQKQKYSLIKIN